MGKIRVIDPDMSVKVGIFYEGIPNVPVDRPAALLEADPRYLKVGDVIGSLMVGTDPVPAEHERESGFLVHVKSLGSGVDPQAHGRTLGRLVLQSFARVRFIRPFETKSLRDDFIDSLKLPAGYSYKKARMLEVGDVVYIEDQRLGCKVLSVSFYYDDIDSHTIRVNIELELKNGGSTAQCWFDTDQKVPVQRPQTAVETLLKERIEHNFSQMSKSVTAERLEELSAPYTTTTTSGSSSNVTFTTPFPGERPVPFRPSSVSFDSVLDDLDDPDEDDPPLAAPIKK